MCHYHYDLWSSSSPDGMSGDSTKNLWSNKCKQFLIRRNLFIVVIIKSFYFTSAVREEKHVDCRPRYSVSESCNRLPLARLPSTPTGRLRDSEEWSRLCVLYSLTTELIIILHHLLVSLIWNGWNVLSSHWFDWKSYLHLLDKTIKI